MIVEMHITIYFSCDLCPAKGVEGRRRGRGRNHAKRVASGQRIEKGITLAGRGGACIDQMT